jgi:hypothetical protein
MSLQFFTVRERAATDTYLGDLRHKRTTHAYLLGRCNNEPLKVLEFFRKCVTREDYEDNEILRRIAMGLRQEGFGDKIRFKSSPEETSATQPKDKTYENDQDAALI